MKIAKAYICFMATIVLYAHPAKAGEVWEQVGGFAQSITASNAGVWIVGTNNGIGNDSSVYWLSPNGWQMVTNPNFTDAKATQVGVSINGAVWAINKAGQIGSVLTPKGSKSSDIGWINSGTATQNGVGVDPAGDVYIRGLDHNLWEWILVASIAAGPWHMMK